MVVLSLLLLELLLFFVGLRLVERPLLLRGETTLLIDFFILLGPCLLYCAVRVEWEGDDKDGADEVPILLEINDILSFDGFLSFDNREMGKAPTGGAG